MMLYGGDLLSLGFRMPLHEMYRRLYTDITPVKET